MTRNVKICLVSSHGGHLREILDSTSGVEGDKYYVTFRSKHVQDRLKGERVYFVTNPHDSLLKYAVNAVQCLWHLVRERPLVVISTGAGIAVPTLVFARLFLRSRIVYIESAAAVVDPTRTGRFVYRFADLFLIQWEPLKKHYPKAIFVGPQ